MEILNSSTPKANATFKLETFWTVIGVYSSSCCLALLTLGCVLVIRYSTSQGNALVDAPIIGPKSALISRYYFFKDAWTYVEEGYKKVIVDPDSNLLHQFTRVMLRIYLNSPKAQSLSCLAKIYWLYPISMLTSFETCPITYLVQFKQTLM